MPTQINAYIHFGGKCREAMLFYQQCLEGELTLLAVEDSPMASQWPAEAQKQILHASLVKDGLMLLASDMSDSGEFKTGNNVSLSLNCGSIEEMQTYFNGLSSEAKSSRPVHDFFGGKIGALTDKFDTSWMFFCEITPG